MRADLFDAAGDYLEDIFLEIAQSIPLRAQEVILLAHELIHGIFSESLDLIGSLGEDERLACQLDDVAGARSS